MGKRINGMLFVPQITLSMLTHSAVKPTNETKQNQTINKIAQTNKINKFIILSVYPSIY
jgi:hypothetical protein